MHVTQYKFIEFDFSFYAVYEARTWKNSIKDFNLNKNKLYWDQMNYFTPILIFVT